MSPDTKTKIKNAIKTIKRCIPGLNTVLDLLELKHRFMPSRKRMGGCADNVIIQYPIHIESPSSVSFEKNTLIREFCHIINSPSEKVVVKSGTVIAANCTIVTNNHTPTVGIPQILLVGSHINDVSSDLIIEECVWVGAHVTLLVGARLGRGCVVAAGAVVNKPVPPYAVVAGVPAKIIASVFTKEQILEHEKMLYREEERLKPTEIDDLFKIYFDGKKSIGRTTEIDLEKQQRLDQLKRYVNYKEPLSNGKSTY